jgi:hypothetical protein
MWPFLILVVQNSVVHAVVAGASAAAWQDIEQWKTYEDARFNYRVASFRWLKGGFAGFVTGAGFGLL